MNKKSMAEHLAVLAAEFCRRHDVSLQGKTVLCAVSGGRDSMVLLHVLLGLSTKQGFSVVVAHYNHRLRESAVRDEELVRGHCAALGIPFFAGSGDVRGYAKERGASIEDAARTMRYAFLQHTAQECGADFIATAHHRQDNAETLLLHLLRGSGLNGLGGIAPVRGNIIRPLLAADRADIDRYVEENNIPYAEDETNQDTVYTRNRVRLELIPLLEEIAPGSVGRMADTASRLRDDEDFLRQYCAKLLPEDKTEIPVSLLRGQPTAIAARLVRMAAHNMGVEPTAAQTGAILSLRRGGCLTLGGGVRAILAGETLRLYRLPQKAAPMTLRFGEQHWGAWRVSMWETDDAVAENAHTVVLRGGLQNIMIAAWDGTGRLGTENGRRTVKRLLADHHIGTAQREHCPAIYADGTLAAVFGAGTEYALRPQSGGSNIVIHLENGVLA